MTTPTYNQNPNAQTDNLSHGSKTVTVAGTAEALSAVSVFTHELLIQAKLSNTDAVYIGGVAVPNNETGGYGMTAGGDLSISAVNLTNVYVNAVVNGEGVTFVYRS